MATRGDPSSTPEDPGIGIEVNEDVVEGYRVG
jgi:L-alanine-DL-glutamate epimerase-like enolase superfamily enzyme